MTGDTGTLTRQASGRRRTVRYVGAGLCGVVAVLYLILMFVVRDVEVAAEVETTYGAYVFLAVPYLVGAVLLAGVDRRVLWAVGAVIQVVILTLFVMFGVGLFGGEGVFEDETLREIPMELWAAAITGAQVVLLGLLSYLALAPAGQGTAASSVARLSGGSPLSA